jgi:hypothetical protein
MQHMIHKKLAKIKKQQKAYYKKPYNLIDYMSNLTYNNIYYSTIE